MQSGLKWTRVVRDCGMVKDDRDSVSTEVDHRNPRASIPGKGKVAVKGCRGERLAERCTASNRGVFIRSRKMPGQIRSIIA